MSASGGSRLVSPQAAGLRQLPADWQRLFLARATRRVRLDATISLEGRLWEVPVQKQIRAGRRNVGALKLSNLLQLDRFEEDLNLIHIRLQPPAPRPAKTRNPTPAFPRRRTMPASKGYSRPPALFVRGFAEFQQFTQQKKLERHSNPRGRGRSSVSEMFTINGKNCERTVA